MSPNKTKDYPLRIENKNITSNILKFKVINNTNSECKIYLDDILIKISEENNTNITVDISNIYKGKLNIKIEAGKKFLYETINRNLEDFFGNLKKTLLGKENTYFLVNDRNNEIRQHYDKNYTCNLDIDKFRQSTLSKKRYLNQRDIDYALFIVPDKSVILRDKLPFKTDPPLRNTPN